ncbi:hypothetical protein D3C75_850160 [compost metagenome]
MKRSGTMVVSLIIRAGWSKAAGLPSTSAFSESMVSRMVLLALVSLTVCVSPSHPVDAPSASPINRSGTIVTSFTRTGGLCSTMGFPFTVAWASCSFSTMVVPISSAFAEAGTHMAQIMEQQTSKIADRIRFICFDPPFNKMQ